MLEFVLLAENYSGDDMIIYIYQILFS